MDIHKDLAELALDLVGGAEDASTPTEVDDVVRAMMTEFAAAVCVGLQIRADCEGPELHVVFGQAPRRWRHEYCRAGHLHADPLVAHALRTLKLAAWDDVRGADPSEAIGAAPQAAQALGLHASIIAPQRYSAGAATAVLLAAPTLDTRNRRFRNAFAAGAAALHRAAERVRRSPPAIRLSRRETEVLFWVLCEMTDKQIAPRLKLSPETVRDYIRSARRKLGATTRFGAAYRASQLGLLPLWLPSERPTPAREPQAFTGSRCAHPPHVEAPGSPPGG